MEKIETAVEVAQAAGRKLADRLADMKKAVEAGHNEEVLQLAKEITKADVRAA